MLPVYRSQINGTILPVDLDHHTGGELASN
jgi:hypothetical protein